MKSDYDSLWSIIFIVLILVASFFAFYLAHYFYYFISNHGNGSYITCNELLNYYENNENITIQGYLTSNCTINGIKIPAGNRIIKIENREIYYI